MADKKTTLKEKVDAELEKSGKINVKRIDKKSQEEFIQQIATRNLLEKDFGEDKLYVTFETKPGTKRTLEAKKPSWEEVMEIIKFSVEAKHLEGKDDADSMDRMSKIYEKLPKIAAQYVLDKSLDEKE